MCRLALDLFRLGSKGLYDVAVIVSEDSDLDPAASDVYSLRDHERWIARVCRNSTGGGDGAS